MTKRYDLFAPGPISTPTKVLNAMATDPPYFAGRKFSALLESIQPMLREVFRTDLPVMIGTGSGTLGMECAVSNFFNTRDAVVVFNTGKYGKNWAEICSRWGLEVVEVVSRPGSPARVGSFKRIMSTERSKIRGVFVTHVETTTGVVNDIRAIREVAGKDTLVVVDGISSLLSEQLISSHYDVVIGASQKALSLPPGLFFMTISEKALERRATSHLPKFYFDVAVEYERTKKNITTFTPASNLIVGLKVTLEEVLKIGVRSLILNARGRAEVARQAFVDAGFELFSRPSSNAVTAVSFENSNKLLAILEDNYNVIIGGGVRELVDKIFRVMHFGWETSFAESKYVTECIIEVARDRFGY